MPTPEEWLRRLHRDINDRSRHVDTLWRYYDGDHPLAFATEKFHEEFGGSFQAFASNWMPTVVDSTVERLHIDGFRVGDGVEASEPAAEIWQANGLDADSQIAHLEAGVSGVAYALTWKAKTEDLPVITIEGAQSAAVAVDPRNRRKRLAGLRLTVDADRRYLAELFLPGQLYQWKSKERVPDAGALEPRATTWVAVPAENGEPEVIDFEPKVVPLVPLHNKQRLNRHHRWLECAQSELVGVIPLQDAVNKLIADMIVASEFAAMPQRWGTGLEPIDDADGKPLPPIEQYRQRLWYSEDSNTRFGQFQAADLGNYIKGIETLVQHIASQSSTPPHYFYLRGEFPSGESIRSAEGALIAKVRDRMRTYGEGWEEVMRVALAMAGETDPLHAIEAIWRDPEFRTEAEQVDAAMKKAQTLQVPLTQIWEDLGYTQEQIRRFPAQKDAERMLGIAFEQAVDLGTAQLEQAEPEPVG